MSSYVLPQPYSDDLSAIAELTTDAFGRLILTFQNGAEICEYIGAISDSSILGATGPQGATGLQGLQGLVWRGSWQSGSSYSLNDVVEYQGSAYVLTGTATGQNPTQDSYWQLLVAKGSIGATGVQGATGAVGATGIGLTGATGLRGATGALGGTGATGASGATGLTGLTGASGPRGATGIQGNQGPSGLHGATGPTGFSGATGLQGVAGSVGATGLTGATGYQGPIGPGGQQGASGPRGFQGATGFTGATGPQGLTGSTGPFGLHDWQIKTSNYLAVNRDRLVAKTTAGSFTVTLPASPSLGDYIQITDGGDFSVHNLIIARNGSTIDGFSDDVAIDISNATFEFIFDGTTWRVTATVGSAGATGPAGVSTAIFAAAAGGSVSQQTLQNLTGMSLTLTPGTWVFQINLTGQSSTAAGVQFGIGFDGAASAIDFTQVAQTSGSSWAATTRTTAINTVGGVVWTAAGTDLYASLVGSIVVTGAGALTVQGLKITSGVLTLRPSSFMSAAKAA